MIVIKEVKTLEDAQTMKDVRNLVSHFMTNDTSKITNEQQEKWWASLDKSRYKPYLVYNVHNGVVGTTIGYGLIHILDDCCKLTGALYPEDRSKGYGRRLFELLLNEARGIRSQIKLEVLDTNGVAINLYKSMGFKEIDHVNGIIHMIL